MRGVTICHGGIQSAHHDLQVSLRGHESGEEVLKETIFPLLSSTLSCD
jgi:hypothetical protein